MSKANRMIAANANEIALHFHDFEQFIKFNKEARQLYPENFCGRDLPFISSQEPSRFTGSPCCG